MAVRTFAKLVMAMLLSGAAFAQGAGGASSGGRHRWDRLYIWHRIWDQCRAQHCHSKAELGCGSGRQKGRRNKASLKRLVKLFGSPNGFGVSQTTAATGPHAACGNLTICQCSALNLAPCARFTKGPAANHKT